MPATLARLALVLGVAASCVSPALAQGGYTTERHPEFGLTFQRARDYEPIPLQPDEKYVVMHFAQKLVEKPREKNKPPPRPFVRPELYIVSIDAAPEGAPTTGTTSAPPTPPAGGGDGAKSGGAEKPADPKTAPKPVVNSFERWVDQELREWKVGKVEGAELKSHSGYTGTVQRLFLKHPERGPISGWSLVWRGATRTVAIVGFAGDPDLDKQIEIWRQTAEKIDIDEPEEQSDAKLAAHYARLTLRDPEFRIGVRKKLVRGWKAEDSDNYIFVYDTTDQPLIRKVINDIELMRKEYEKLFPSVAPVTAVSTVRICKSREEYMTYGGPPSSAGYWNWVTEELVLYDAETVDRNHRTSDADTFIVLYHEAFHQYIHYSAGELPPHSWFNEGHGDYFSGARIRDGKMRSIGVNPWRVATIQHAIETGKSIPLEQITQFEQPQYYAPDIVHVCYAEGWSIIYFLRTCKDVAKKPEWARILPTYFETLKTAYADELVKAGNPDREKGAAKRAAAGLEARKRALEAAFQGVDMSELQSAWKDYTLSLALPKDK